MNMRFMEYRSVCLQKVINLHNCFMVVLSEMRLWTRPLSAREIKANVCGVDPSTNGLVSYWRMNEGEGTTFYDLSPSKRDISYKNGITIDWTYDDTNKCLE